MKKKPRVLIDSFHLFQALTGIRTYTTLLCSGIEKADFEEVDYIICPNWRWLNRTSFLRGKVNIFKKVVNHVLYFFWKQCCLPILILVKRVDLIVATDYLLPYFKFGARGVAVFHDTFYWELKGNYNPVWRWYFLKSVHLGLNGNTEIIVTSNYIAEKVKKNVGNRIKLSVVYQAPKNLDNGGEVRIDNNGLGIPDGSGYFLHVGLFEERKNLRVLIQAFGRLLHNESFKDFYLILAGSRGVGWFHDDFHRLNKLIKDLKLEERVIMPGFVPNKELGNIYRGAFAYVFPSKEEGFGIPIIEAMKLGVPVIISNQPALVEIAGDAALTFEMDSEEELFDEMIKMKSSELRERLIIKGYARAQKFTQDSFVNQFHNVVRKNLNV